MLIWMSRQVMRNMMFQYTRRNPMTETKNTKMIMRTHRLTYHLAQSEWLSSWNEETKRRLFLGLRKVWFQSLILIKSINYRRFHCIYVFCIFNDSSAVIAYDVKYPWSIFTVESFPFLILSISELTSLLCIQKQSAWKILWLRETDYTVTITF